MHEVLHAKQAETGRTQAIPAKQPAGTKRHIQRTIDPTRLPLYTQAWGNQPPPWLRLPTPLTPSNLQQTSQQEAPVQGRFEPTQSQDSQTSGQENNTGLPNSLKAGIETLSGMSMDDVSVHYNSPQPAQVQALAYTQGTHIHVAPGQERHLAHEAWHAVQQKQGRVQPTLHARGVTINDDQHLEREADTMGGQALQYKKSQSYSSIASAEPDRETDQLAMGCITQLKGKNALTSSHSAGSGTPDTETVVQMVETVPKKGTKLKVKEIREKLAALIKEAAERSDTLKKVWLILTSSFAAIEKPHSVMPDMELKVGALASYIDYLMERIHLLTSKLKEIENEHGGTSLPFDFGVEELPDILNAANMIATGPELDKIVQWFEKETVAARKQGHKLPKELPPAPGVTPATVTAENAETFLKLPAAPLLNVSYLTLTKSIGPIKGCAFQGAHDNKEKNLPTPKFQHKCQNLIELSIDVPALSGGRAVVDIETGKVYITEHYGQNIVKLLLSLATKPVRTVAENQELHALFFLKKLINDFVLVTDIPDDIHQKMMDVACRAYLDVHVALEQFNPPPTGIAFQTWCIKTLPVDILQKANIHKNQIAWTRWMLYCHGQPQHFDIPDGCPLSSDFMLLTLTPALPVLRRVAYVVDLMKITAPYGTIVILETRFATGQNKRVCFIRAGSIASPQWIKFGEVPTYTVQKQ